MKNKVFKAVLGALFLGVVTVPVMARGGSGSSHSSGSSHYVAPHVTKNGTYVEGHMQTNPNGTKLDNWSTKGNVNPYTGQPGTKNPDGSSSANTGAKTLTSTAGSNPMTPATPQPTTPLAPVGFSPQTDMPSSQILPYSPN